MLFEKITLYTEIFKTRKVELWIFFTQFIHEKRPQNKFSRKKILKMCILNIIFIIFHNFIIPLYKVYSHLCAYALNPIS